MHVIHAHDKNLRRNLHLKFLEIRDFTLRSVFCAAYETTQIWKILFVACIVGVITMAPTPSSPSSKSICHFFFTEVRSCKWQCKKCLKTKSKNGGWTNLISHLRTCVGTDYEKVFLDHQKASAASNSTMSAFFVRVSDREKEMHQWIQFSHCDDESSCIICR
jgi:BED zinc finger